MVTAEEIRAIKVFECLDDVACERLARVAADINLVPGEFAAEEGAERALFAVLEGRIEATRIVDGIDRVLGERLPGDVFGEVPIILGTFFPVGFRAAEPTRVMRIEPHDYHAVASVTPEVAQEIGKLASHRMSGSRGLQGLAAAPPPPRATVVGHKWDAHARACVASSIATRSRFTWLTPDAPDAAEQWGGPLPTDGDLPVIRVVGGKTVVRPQHRRVAELLGLDTESKAAEYDTVIVGAGPGGLAAAVYGASEGLRTIVVEREAPGGQAGTSSRIENYLGFPAGVSGDELASRALQQARRLGAEILVTREVARIDAHARAGPSRRRRRAPREDDHPRVRRDLAATRDRRLRPARRQGHLVRRRTQRGSERARPRRSHRRRRQLRGTGGDVLLDACAHGDDPLPRRRAREEHVALPHRPAGDAGEHQRVDADPRSPPRTARHHSRRSTSATSTAARTTRLESGGLFIFIGADAETDWLPPEIALDPKGGFVLTGAGLPRQGRWELERDPYLLETSVPGIFACGDVRFSPIKRVPQPSARAAWPSPSCTSTCAKRLTSARESARLRAARTSHVAGHDTLRARRARRLELRRLASRSAPAAA